MLAVPSEPGAGRSEDVTGVSCPECPGVLAVSVEGDSRFFYFRCRIGHAFSVNDLLAAKEKRLEDHLWAVVTALDELATLLQDLAREGALHQIPYEDRVALARRHAEAMRRLIEENRPVQLDEPTTT